MERTVQALMSIHLRDSKFNRGNGGIGLRISVFPVCRRFSLDSVLEKTKVAL